MTEPRRHHLEAVHIAGHGSWAACRCGWTSKQRHEQTVGAHTAYQHHIDTVTASGGPR